MRQWNLDQSEFEIPRQFAGVEGKIFDEAIDHRVDRKGPHPETGMFDLYQTRSAAAPASGQA